MYNFVDDVIWGYRVLGIHSSGNQSILFLRLILSLLLLEFEVFYAYV